MQGTGPAASLPAVVLAAALAATPAHMSNSQTRRHGIIHAMSLAAFPTQLNSAD